jgi:hypothetical protein
MFIASLQTELMEPVFRPQLDRPSHGTAIIAIPFGGGFALPYRKRRCR